MDQIHEPLSEPMSKPSQIHLPHWQFYWLQVIWQWDMWSPKIQYEFNDINTIYIIYITEADEVLMNNAEHYH